MTIADVIEMTRIIQTFSESVVTLSPDGSKLASVLWRGDLKTDRNVYSIVVIDVSDAQPVETLLDIEIATDGAYFRPPIQKLSFDADGRSLVFLGSLEGEPHQVYTLSLSGGPPKALTSHESSVSDYSISGDGNVLMYSAPNDWLSKARPQMEREGFSVFETEATPPRGQSVALGNWGRGSPQFFLIRNPEAEPKLVFDSSDLKGRILGDLEPGSYSGEGQYFTVLQSGTMFSVSPNGRHVLIWPYVPSGEVVKLSDYRFYSAADEITDHLESLMSPRIYRVAAPFGLVDIESGAIEKLLDAPHDAFVENADSFVWAPDGSSVVVSTLLPLDSDDPTVNAARSEGPPSLVEVEIESRRVSQLEVDKRWRAIRWDPTDNVLTLLGRKENAPRFSPPDVAVIRKRNNGWGDYSVLGAASDLNSQYSMAVMGNLVCGVKDSLTEAPNIALHRLESGKTTVLTDLNPALRDKEFSQIEKMFWKSSYDDKCFGYLVKPLGFNEGVRYPLAFLIKDIGGGAEDNSYLIDGQLQLSGFAIQTLAASGIMVLFAPDPPSLRDVIDTPEEGDHVKAQIESAIEYLDENGRIDAARVGLSGWSRAGFHTNKVLVISDHPFAAASLVDGGTSDYTSHGYASFIHGRPWKLTELERIKTPIMFEAHGITDLYISGMFDAMDRMGKPVDCYFYPDGSHFLRLPLHRWGSLTRNVDWFRFWLQDYEDPDPARAKQYERWRELRWRRDSQEI